MKLKVTEPPECAHCGEIMCRYDLPPASFSDGLGWGTGFLWMCANDDCPIFQKGFEHTISNYGQTSSLRSIVEPDTGNESVIPAFSTIDEHFEKFKKIRDEMRNE